MLCEMCSSPNVAYKIDVEGSRLNVCEKCASFGKVVSRVAAEPKREKKKESIMEAQTPKTTETVQVIKSDCARLIKNARERLGLNQEDFAKRLMEKESLLHKIESGHMKPDLVLARKLEKFLKISIVEQVELEVGDGTSDKKRAGSGLTIGDVLRIK
jgi:putative transcription factor